jgi:hypothetical protein
MEGEEAVGTVCEAGTCGEGGATKGDMVEGEVKVGLAIPDVTASHEGGME